MILLFLQYLIKTFQLKFVSNIHTIVIVVNNKTFARLEICEMLLISKFINNLYWYLMKEEALPAVAIVFIIKFKRKVGYV